MRLHVVSDVHGKCRCAPAGRRRRRCSGLPRRPGAVHRLRRPRCRHPRRPVRRRRRVALHRHALRAPLRRGARVLPWPVGVARPGPRRGHRRGHPQAVRRPVRRDADSGVRHLRQRRRAPVVRRLRARGHPRARRRDRRDRWPDVRLRRRRAADTDAHAVRDLRTRSTPRRSRRSAPSTCCAATSRRHCRC